MMFENPVISSASQTAQAFEQIWSMFENPVIFSASQIWNDVGIAFEYHVILSSSKPSKR